MTDRDPFVRHVLETLPIPDHGPGFWSRLDRALADADAEPRPAPAPIALVPPLMPDGDADDGDADDDDAGVAAEVALEPHDGRDSPHPRRRLAARVVGIAATVAVVIAGGALLVSQDGDTGPDLSSVPGPTEPESVSPGTSAAGTTAIAPSDDARDAVLTFVDALGAGDHGTAASLLGLRSEAYAESEYGSVDEYLTQASEGYGAWSTSTDREAHVIMIDPGAAVVLLSGTRMAEGVMETRVDAMPVQQAASAGVWLVEPIAFGADVEDQRFDIIEPAPVGEDPLPITPGGAVQIGIPSPGTMYFSLDGAPPTAVPTVEGDLGETATFTVPGPREGGGAILTVAFVSDDATTFTAFARRVEISD